MTRLLDPQIFGVMAIAFMVMTGLAMISDFGLKQNIIHSNRGNEQTYLNTAWSIQIIRGLSLWSLALFISLLVFSVHRLGLTSRMNVYSDPELPYVIATISFSAVISGFESTKFSEASRKLLLSRVTQIQIWAQIIGLICMIGWVLIDRSIWALVAGNICSTTMTTLLSHIAVPGTVNRLQWDRSAIREIFHFGKWMFLSSILGFLANNTDRIILGALVDSATLGVYAVAFNVVSVFGQILGKLISDVSFSAFSEVARERTHQLKRSLYRFHFVTASFAYFCSGFLIVFGSTLINFLYDYRYAQAGWMVEILGITLLSISFNLAQYCLLAKGLPRVFTTIIAIRVLATIALIPFGFHMFGITGAVWAIVISQLSSAPTIVFYQVRYGLFDPLREIMVLRHFLRA